MITAKIFLANFQFMLI